MNIRGTKKKPYDAIVYIGRFQPFTNAHYEIVRHALSLADKVIIVIGSARRARSFRNPWTAEERKEMICSIKELKSKGTDIRFILQPNSNYNFTWWVKDVQEQVTKHMIADDKKIGIIGHKKDASSYYLNYFPQWDFIELPELADGLSATEVRQDWFNHRIITSLSVPKEVFDWLEKWEKQHFDIFKQIHSEYYFIEEYKRKWANAPFQPIFVTTDAMVICKGHILLIRRKNNPGKDLYGMPGGFIEPTEYLKDSAVRELKEETRICVDKAVLKNSIKLVKVFDDPYRDPRGRAITHCFLFNLNLKELPRVKGSDDAYGARWIPLGDLDQMQNMFFGDHYQIIKNMLGQID